jgi:nucleoside-diphosphate-sugar epimerase
MRVLLIGGTNFIGPYVVAALHRLDCEITVYHRGQHEPDLPPQVRHVHSPDAGIPVLTFPAELTEPAPDVVLHMFPVGQDDARAAMSRFAGRASRMVALSSGDVYRAYGRLLGTEPGLPEPVPLDENAPLRAKLYPYRANTGGPLDWTYHYEKILVEQAVMTHASLTGTILRLPAVYGPGDPYHRLRPYLRRMDDGRSAIPLDSAQADWRWTHGYVENVASAIALAVVDERAAGEVFNVGEADTPSLIERVDQIGRVAGWMGRIVPVAQDKLPPHLRAPFQPGQNLVVATRKIREQLGYTELVSVEAGLRRTVDWERATPWVARDPTSAEYAAEDAALN